MPRISVWPVHLSGQDTLALICAPCSTIAPTPGPAPAPPYTPAPTRHPAPSPTPAAIPALNIKTQLYEFY